MRVTSRGGMRKNAAQIMRSNAAFCREAVGGHYGSVIPTGEQDTMTNQHGIPAPGPQEQFIDKFGAKWFEWLKWLTLTAAIYAVATKSGSIVLGVIAFISASAVLWKGILTVDRFYVAILPPPNAVSRFVGWLLTSLVALTQILLMWAISVALDRTVLK